MSEQFDSMRKVPPDAVPDRSAMAPRQASSRRLFLKLASPWWSRVLLGLNLAAYVAVFVGSYVLTQQIGSPTYGGVLFSLGAKVNARILFCGEYWRLLTATFLHVDEIHLMVNLISLMALGNFAEAYFGHRRFLTIYFVAGIAGSLASYAMSPNPSVGASGAIFGLAGALVVYFLYYREAFGERGRGILQSMLVMIGLNLFFGFSMAQVDNWGHIGGLVGGAVAAWGLRPRYLPPDPQLQADQRLREAPRLFFELGWTLLLLVMLYYGLQVANVMTPANVFSAVDVGCSVAVFQ